MMAVRLRVGEVARQQGLTIKALAAHAGVAYNTAHSIATGRATRIDLDTLDRICGALHVEPGELFVRFTTPEPAHWPIAADRHHPFPHPTMPTNTMQDAAGVPPGTGVVDE